MAAPRQNDLTASPHDKGNLDVLVNVADIAAGECVTAAAGRMVDGEAGTTGLGADGERIGHPAAAPQGEVPVGLVNVEGRVAKAGAGDDMRVLRDDRRQARSAAERGAGGRVRVDRQVGEIVIDEI